MEITLTKPCYIDGQTYLKGTIFAAFDFTNDGYKSICPLGKPIIVPFDSAEQKGTANVILPKSELNELTKKEFNQVVTSITVDDSKYFPKSIPDSNQVLLTYAEGDKTIAPEGLVNIDCGFSINLAPGFQVKITLSDRLKKSMYLVTTTITTGRISFRVLNKSDKSVSLETGEVVGTMEVESVYYFNWRLL